MCPGQLCLRLQVALICTDTFCQTCGSTVAAISVGTAQLCTDAVVYAELVAYAAGLSCKIQMRAIAQILGSIQSEAIQLVVTGIAADSTEIVVGIVIAGAALLIINSSACNPAVVIHTVKANLCTPIVVAQINRIRIVGILAAVGFSPDTVTLHMRTQQVAAINYVRSIIAPGKHCAGSCRSCAFHQCGFVVAANINTAATDEAAYAAVSTVEFHVADPTGNTRGGQAGAYHSLTGQVFINAGIAIVNLLAQCLEGCFYRILVVGFNVLAACCRNHHRILISPFHGEVAALVIAYIGACIIMIVAYDMSTAEAAHGNGTGIGSHADKAVDGNFYFLIIAAIRIDIFNCFYYTLAAL